MKQPSVNCINIIKKCEGLELKPYLCPAGVPTIGYGSTRYENGERIKLTDAPITEERANALLLNTLKEYGDAVNRYVKVDINQNKFDALVDFAYNAGIGSLQTSTLLKLLNKGDTYGASLEFKKWVHAGGKVLTGLVKRRKLEEELFNA